MKFLVKTYLTRGQPRKVSVDGLINDNESDETSETAQPQPGWALEIIKYDLW